MQQSLKVIRPTWPLATIALLGQLAIAAITGLLARRLSLDQFEAYAVASAAFMLGVTMAPLGAEKLALRVMPPLLDGGNWSQGKAYLRFALVRAFVGTTLVGALALTWAFGLRDLSGAAQAAFLAGVVALPPGVLTHLGLEVLTAAGAAGFATLMVRLTVPGVVLALVSAMLASGTTLTGAVAVGAWGIGWTVAALAMLARLRSAVPGLWRANPGAPEVEWRHAAVAFWLYRAAVGLMAQAPIIALDWLGGTAEAVGAYAVATTVVGLGVALSTATNRVYAREIAIQLQNGEPDELARLARRRRRWLLPCIAAFLALVFAFSHPLLAAFRPDFVADGLWPIRILALTAALSMTLALAPTVLKYRDRNRALLRTVTGCATVQIVLLLLLVPRFGATGAALGYGLSTALMYGAFALVARSEVESLTVAR